VPRTATLAPAAAGSFGADRIRESLVAAPTCSSCQSPLNHLTGHAVIRLYRCGKCGEQQMIPGDPLEQKVPAAPVAPARPEEKKGFFSRIFGG
jgi:hypothetical protein